MNEFKKTQVEELNDEIERLRERGGAWARRAAHLSSLNAELVAALERIATDEYTQDDHLKVLLAPDTIWKAIARAALAKVKHD